MEGTRRAAGRASMPTRIRRRVGRRLKRWQNQARNSSLGLAATVLRAVRPGAATEERILRMNWASRDAARLDEYLVIGWQNPRINVQSILIRHALVHRLFGDEFADLERAELELAVELNEALRQEAARTRVHIHSYLDARRQAAIREVSRVIEPREHEMEQRWRLALDGRSPEPLAVLELACGSANDYRAFVDFGLAPFLDYTGIDLNPKNIDNARRRFPAANFLVGNAMSTGRPDASADVVIASDLFEHLPFEVANGVLAEATRIARDGLILSFFNMADVPDHVDQPVAAYHWNLLSAPRMVADLQRTFPSVTAIEIPAWLQAEFGYAHTYNPAAWTILADRVAVASSGGAAGSRGTAVATRA
ncbi:MAG TPA: class I SAM-dependent methyltransferase [Candidatus Limnocylindrales bacterium]|nr:class I SAM-dependent methyltransferase [Candidatus Limnocylindrales bacterium]